MTFLWQHQIDAIKYAMDRRESLLYLGMGCGKTRIALEVAKQVLAANPRGRVLVGCPRAVKAAWAKQAALWLPDVRVLVLDKGTAKQKEQQVAVAMADLSPLIVVGNYETLRLMPSIEKQSWCLLVWDEVHKLKSPSGSAARWAARVCKRNPQAKRLGLSGTLISHSPMDAWGVWRAVESPDCPTWGDSFTIFKARHFTPHPHIRGAVLGMRRDAEPEFSRRVQATTFHRRSEDVLDLPPLMFEDVAVELTAKEAALYREVEREFCAVCDKGTVTPANAMVAVLRLQQISGGFVTYDEETQATQIDLQPSKQATLEDRLEALDIDEPVVVFCRFRSDIAAVHAAAKAVGRITSELSGKIDDLARWQAGATNLLAVQIASGGIGVDLTRASYGFFYSLGHSLSEYLQAVARLHRPGQERTTHFYHLVATLPGGRKTVDGRVYEALQQRKDVIDAIIGDYRTREGHAGHHARTH